MTKITVYAIAFGGKFIGTGQVGVAKLTVTDADKNPIKDQDGLDIVNQPITQNGLKDGSGDTEKIMGPGYNWGVPIDKTGAFSYTFSFQPTAPMQLTFKVDVYHYHLLKATAINQQVVWDGRDLTGDTSVVVVVPGLLTNVDLLNTTMVYNSENPVKVSVYMMCGCEVNQPFWPQSNFDVKLSVFTKEEKWIQDVNLDWDGLSTLTGKYVPSTKGELIMRSFAIEKINGNTACSDPVIVTVV